MTDRGRLPYKPANSRAGSDESEVLDHPKPMRRFDRTGPTRRSDREADLSTEQAGAQAPSRLSRPHGHQGWPQGHRCPARPRSQEAHRVSSRLARFDAMERLRQRADFLAAASGSKVPSKSFVLQTRKRNDDGPVRIGFTVSKKVGNAVERNRVRRRLWEIVRHSDALPTRPIKHLTMPATPLPTRRERPVTGWKAPPRRVRPPDRCRLCGTARAWLAPQSTRPMTPRPGCARQRSPW